MQQKCILCHKKTKSMYLMNKGLYCEKHKELGIIEQEFDLKTKEFEERLKLFRQGWDNKTVTFVNFGV